MKAQRQTITESYPPGLRLHNGDRLTQAEYHRRYKLTPDDFRAELIGGTVYLRHQTEYRHGVHHAELMCLFGLYRIGTPGVAASGRTTILLSENSEPEPDGHLAILPDYGGQTSESDDGFVIGAPELIGEVAYSRDAIDFGQKKIDYQGAGALEYLILSIEEQELHWFHFPSRRKLKPDRNGIFKSRVFPGLWFDQEAFFAEDSLSSIEILKQGLASREHAEFVARLQRDRKKSK